MMSNKAIRTIRDDLNKFSEGDFTCNMHTEENLCIELTEMFNYLNNTKVLIERTSKIDRELSSQIEVVSNAIRIFLAISLTINEIIPKIESMSKAFYIIRERKSEILDKVDNVSAISQEI